MLSEPAPRALPRPIVLVHGAWHGAWCWSALQAELDRRGIGSWALDLPGHGASSEPLTGLHGDAAAVTAALASLAAQGHDDVVLVGHSYGGAVISAAGAAPSVGHLVYLAAFVLDAGESVGDLMRGPLPRLRVTLDAAIRRGEGGTTILDPAVAGSALYGACPPAAVAAALSRLVPEAMVSMTEASPAAAWRAVASTYVVCSQDEAVHPDHQRIMAQRCGTVVEFATDHSPFLSAVTETADLLERLARER